MPKILAIDDKADNLVTLSALLKNLMPGCTVVTAQSGIEGLREAKTGQPDVILLDVKMPDMDGFETCRRLTSDETTRHIPVIMVTAIKTDPKSRVKGLEIGANTFLAKPIDEYELVSQVKVALRIKKAEDALRREKDSLEQLVEKRTAVLRESEAKYRLLVENQTDMVVKMDLEGRFLFVSPSYCRTLGKNEKDLLDQKFSGFVHQEDRDRTKDAIKNLYSPPHTICVENRALTGKGEMWLSWLYTAVLDKDGILTEIIGAGRDITGQKQGEAEREKLQAQLTQARKMESVGRLAGGVAHDFNNMLTVILGYAQSALDETDPSDPLYTSLKEILNAAGRSTEITRQLLAFARKQAIAPQVMDLNRTVEGMLKMLRRLIGEDIDLVWKPGENLWPVMIDPSQIDQILANLCVNARDAISDRGRITIETGPASFDNAYCTKHTDFIPGDFVMMAVSDNGCGMDKETLDNLFEPFFTTKDLGKGTGLGLATVYGIVKQNNGFIHVSSEPGQHTVFRIYLPSHLGQAPGLPKQKTGEIPLGRGETILIVEDEAVILDLCKLMLERLGYTVLTAATPKEALRLAETAGGEIQLLMTDVVMPEMNGRDLAKQLTMLCPDIKLLFMSGYTANVIEHQGVLGKGMNFIQKPFSKNALAVKVNEALGGAGQNINRNPDHAGNP
jgi:PAS domain S-box-containing protein